MSHMLLQGSYGTAPGLRKKMYNHSCEETLTSANVTGCVPYDLYHTVQCIKYTQ